MIEPSVLAGDAMKSRPFLTVLLVTLPALARGETSVPDTPAGRALSAWLDALNVAEHQQAFYDSYKLRLKPEELSAWRDDVGGYDLLETYSSDPTNIFFRVKMRKRPREEFGRIGVDANAPATINALGAWGIPLAAEVDPIRLDDAMSAKVIERTAGYLERFHEDAASGKKLAAALRKRAAQGDYRGITFGDALANKVTKDLREAGHDNHLELRFSYVVNTPESDAKQAEEDARRALAANCGFEKAEHLQPNVGYLKLNFFPDAQTCAPTASAAMNFLADSDALILDLRDNNGGRGDLATFITSYFFAAAVHISDGYRRADNVTMEDWTLANVPGKRFIQKPVYVLISKRTFSAGEAVAFVLQDQKRATLVGETTVGGSGTIEFKPIDDHFTVVVPTGRVISPVTKKAWAGTGVEPDVKVPAAEALATALKLATEQAQQGQ
jgi:hypothetical protein